LAKLKGGSIVAAGMRVPVKRAKIPLCAILIPAPQLGTATIDMGLPLATPLVSARQPAAKM